MLPWDIFAVILPKLMFGEVLPKLIKK